MAPCAGVYGIPASLIALSRASYPLPSRRQFSFRYSSCRPPRPPHTSQAGKHARPLRRSNWRHQMNRSMRALINK
eukprot:1185914-Prorocentrum_minimum.AAC.3